MTKTRGQPATGNQNCREKEISRQKFFFLLEIKSKSTDFKTSSESQLRSKTLKCKKKVQETNKQQEKCSIKDKQREVWISETDKKIL